MVNLAAYFLTALSLMCCFFPNVLADAGSLVEHSPVVESKIEVSGSDNSGAIAIENIEDSSDGAR